jgi:hypothetical protein
MAGYKQLQATGQKQNFRSDAAVDIINLYHLQITRYGTVLAINNSTINTDALAQP